MNITPLDITQKQFRTRLPRPRSRGGGGVPRPRRRRVRGAREGRARAARGQPPQGARTSPSSRAASARCRRRSSPRRRPRRRSASPPARRRRSPSPTPSCRRRRSSRAPTRRFLRIVDDINELKRQRIQFETNVRTLVESHVKLLDAFREPAREEAVQFMPRKTGDRGVAPRPLSGPRPSDRPCPTSTSSGTFSAAAALHLPPHERLDAARASSSPHLEHELVVDLEEQPRVAPLRARARRGPGASRSSRCPPPSPGWAC